MKKTGVIIFLSLLLLMVVYPSVSANDSGIITDQELVKISIGQNGLDVVEEIKVTNNGFENASSIRFWIQQNAQDTKIIEKDSGKELLPLLTGNVRTCNLSAVNLTIEPAASRFFRISYTLATTEQYFIKTLFYDTTSFSVTYKDGTSERDLFSGEHLIYGSDVNNAFQIRLFKPTEAPLNITLIVIALLVVVVVLASLLLLLKKQRRKTKSAVVESEETLTTKKTLLLSLLKDLEKQYRAHAVSDETYMKLKEEYKDQAVDAMKKLDELKK